MTEPEKPVTSFQPIKIDWWARLLLSVVGAGGLAGGGVATFTRDVEAGPVALIAIGGLFFLIALSGLMPTRLKFGDNEAEWKAVQEYVEATVDDASAEDRPELLSRLQGLARSAPQATGPAIEAVLYEATLLEMIREIAHDVRPEVTTLSVVGVSDRHFDMQVTGPQGRIALVEIKFRSSPSRAFYDSLYERFLKSREQLPGANFLIVTPDTVHPAGRALMAEHPDVQILQVTGYEDLQILRQTLIELVGPLEN
jgi:hypothetical protein